jgi:hypothetical protein
MGDMGNLREKRGRQRTSRMEDYGDLEWKMQKDLGKIL